MKHPIRLLFLLLVSLIPPAFAQSNAAHASDELTSQLIKLHSGITLNYVVQGKADGPVIVLLHGAGDSWHSYQRVLPLIPSNYRVYAVTLRGHGLSDHPSTGYSRTDFAGDILDLLDQLKIQHATLVGHSLGSFVAQSVAELDQGRHIDRLVLIGSAPGAPSNPQVREAIRSEFNALHDPIDYTFARDFQASTIQGSVPAWFFEVMVAEAQRVPAATWHGLATSLTSDEPAGALGKIQVPTLILWGDRDSIFSRDEQDALVKHIAHAKLLVYPGTGHALHWEQPVKFSHDLLAFIAATPNHTANPH